MHSHFACMGTELLMINVILWIFSSLCLVKYSSLKQHWQQRKFSMLILIFFSAVLLLPISLRKKEICSLDSFHNVIHLKICRGLKYKWTFRWKVAINLNKMEGKKKNLTDIKQNQIEFQTENDLASVHSLHFCVYVWGVGICIWREFRLFFFSKTGRTKKRNSYWGTIIGNFLKLCKDYL